MSSIAQEEYGNSACGELLLMQTTSESPSIDSGSLLTVPPLPR
jgi:hypothetical protein